MERATVIGTGAMGTLCALLLARKGTRTTLWGRSPERVAAIRADGENKRYLPGHRLGPSLDVTDDAGTALSDPELIISAVPCQYLRRVWTSLLGVRRVTAPVVSVAKGIEVGTLLRPTQILAELIGESSLAVLSGPSLAAEIASGLPAAVVVASEDSRLAVLVQESLSTPTFRIYTNSDPIGVELGGAVKNVIGIAAGIADGLRMGHNAKASLLTRGLVEITRLGVAMGASAETFKGLAGIGDLITTSTSRLSRNHSAGESLGRGVAIADAIAACNGVIEGIDSARSILQLAQRHHVEMPITQAVYSVLFENRCPTSAINELMTRRLRSE